MTPLKKAMGIGVAAVAILVPSATTLMPSATASAAVGKFTGTSFCQGVYPPEQTTVGNVEQVRGLVQRCTATSTAFTGNATTTTALNVDLNRTTFAGPIWGTFSQANPGGGTWVGTFTGTLSFAAQTLSYGFNGFGTGPLHGLCIVGHAQGTVTDPHSPSSTTTSGRIFNCEDNNAQ